MDYRTEIATLCSQTVVEDNPLLSLFDAIEAQQSDPGRHLCCIHCQAAITTEKDKIEVNSRHTFQVTNPSGIDFNVACFQSAWGCGIFGETTDRYSWFPGYNWQYAYCLSCEDHLGWYYANGRCGNEVGDNSSEQHFFGLIADKLMPADGGRHAA